MCSGASQTKRYRTPSAGPFDWCGQTSTLRNCRRFSSKRTTMPPTAPEPDADRPDEFRVDRIGRGPAALAAAHRVPHRPRDAAVAAAALDPAVARAAIRRLVLLVAEDVVGNLVVDGDVIDLRVGQALAEPRASAVDRDRQPLVVGDDHPIGVGRIDPDVVVIAARRRGAQQRRASARRRSTWRTMPSGNTPRPRRPARPPCASSSARGPSRCGRSSPAARSRRRLRSATPGRVSVSLPSHGTPSPVSISA